MAIGHVEKATPSYALLSGAAGSTPRVSVIVTDDLFSFRIVADQRGMEHQVFQFHVYRRGGRTLHELSETVPKEWL